MLQQVDAAILQYQNQKLVQQLERQKQELHDFESNIRELKEKQTSYDEILINVNQLWNQVPDVLLFIAQLVLYVCMACNWMFLRSWLMILFYLEDKRGQVQVLYNVWIVQNLVVVIFGLCQFQIMQNKYLLIIKGVTFQALFQPVLRRIYFYVGYYKQMLLIAATGMEKLVLLRKLLHCVRLLQRS